MNRHANSARRGRWPLQALLLLCAMAGPVAALSGEPARALSAASVKAAFVVRFAGYITWPESSLQTGRFVIAVLDAPEVVQNLQALVAGRTLLRRPVQVREVSSLRAATDAQILYVGSGHRGNRRTLLAPLQGQSTLVITEEQAGLPMGSAINLLVVDQRVRFEISKEAADRADLSISSDLLALALRVHQ